MRIRTMDVRRAMPKTVSMALAAICLQLFCAHANGARAGVVDKIHSIDVVDPSPISVELLLGQDRCIAAENAVLTVRLKNVSNETITLRGFNPNSSMPYIWLSVDEQDYKRGIRIHPGDVYVPSQGKSITLLTPNQTMEFQLFLGEHTFVAPISRDLSTERGSYHLSVLLCPVLTLDNGETETNIAVESNTLQLSIDAPTKREFEALSYLADFWRTQREDRRSPADRFREFLSLYPEVPYAGRIRFNLVKNVHLSEYSQRNTEIDPILLKSIQFCLDRGSPFADAVLTRTGYFEFFQKMGRLDLLEKAATILASKPDYDDRFHKAQAYAGMSSLQQNKDQTWQKRIQPILFRCLKRSLERGDDYAVQIAGQLLHDLERLKEWKLLERAATLVPEDSIDYAQAQRAAIVAREHLNR